MLYNNPKKFDNNLFLEPTSEYRSTPFWAWNSDLSHEVLKEQIDFFRDMGFGGFHMHVRQGLTEEYLGEGFMKAVGACVERAKENRMLAWCYDEDRWPSGYCGGRVTEKIRNRQKYLLNTQEQKKNATEESDVAYETGAPLFLGAFDIFLDSSGMMTEYKMVNPDSPAISKAGFTVKRRYFYCMTNEGGELRFNYQSYVDTLSKPAMDEFIKLTYDKYYEHFGEDFGKTVPAFFTDEPQVKASFPMPSGFSDGDGIKPFTVDFPDTFLSAFGYDIRKKLPELFYATADEGAYLTRYHFNRHVSCRFNEAFMDNIGKWCGEHGVMITGHSMGEDTLYEQLLSNPDVMRTYKEMQLPGIDVLCDDRNFIAAIQCRSVVRQYGREAMLSELYGVTGWDFDFRGHKFQGDWQAALGVTVRVPHLAWQTMKGEGKRDYPASISYQSPWALEYKHIEDHFARINTAMTRGKASPKVAVIHPVESYGILFAAAAQAQDRMDEMESHFGELSSWLLGAFVDYDYIAESLFPELCESSASPLKVGECSYDTVIVSDCLTLRATTVERLKAFAKAGGKLIIMGNEPRYIDGAKSEKIKEFCKLGFTIPHSKPQLMELVGEYRDITLTKDGVPLSSYLHGMREDGEERWLFLAHSTSPELPHEITYDDAVITVRGSYKPTFYNTLTGEITPMEYKTEGGKTLIPVRIYALDTLLIRLTPTASGESHVALTKKAESKELKSGYLVDYKLSEPNVLLLDMAEYSLDGEEWREKEEILRIDEAIRTRLGFDLRKRKFVQPWYVSGTAEDHTLKLRFTVVSDCDFNRVSLALENADKSRVVFNGAECPAPEGYYVDKEIKTVLLGDIRKGENVIEVTMPFGLRTDLESMYLLGEFGTRYRGRETRLIPLPEKLYFGNVVGQGLDFYGGNITYTDYVDVTEDGELVIEAGYYRAALIKVLLDGIEVGVIFTPPYKLTVKGVKKGEHRIDYVAYGNRYNTFSALHNLAADKKRQYIGPMFWHSEGDIWSYEYNTRPMGILKAPTVAVAK